MALNDSWFYEFRKQFFNKIMHLAMQNVDLWCITLQT